ncbi:hypothetical protein SCc_743 [Serratia symbiotica str. 'Cinara cedri']|nr:hypothetical protein SCc_743 [Serratia symbiotica str. 'Cinara cedri']
MRQLPKILLATSTIVIIIIALLISVLRLVLPTINYYRPQLLEMAVNLSQIPIHANFIQGSWHAHGPRLEMRDINATTPKGSIYIKRLIVTIDAWRSLLYWRWQFRDITVYELELNMNTILSGNNYPEQFIEPKKMIKLGLQQLANFNLRNSRISFLTNAGLRTVLEIPQIIVRNNHNRHRAEGNITLLPLNGQRGMIHMRMDLLNNNELLNRGTIYIQADNIDMKHWFTHLMYTNIAIKNVECGVESWIQIQDNNITGAHIILKQGIINWSTDTKQHQVNLDNLVLSTQHADIGWHINLSKWQMSVNGKTLTQDEFYALWLPENKALGQNTELRIRATDIQLESISLLLPACSFLSPELLKHWNNIHPQGIISILALDIPLTQPEQTRFKVVWQNINWRPWKHLPGINHFSGTLGGLAIKGRLAIDINDSQLTSNGMFREPIEIHNAHGAIIWRYHNRILELSSKDIDIKAKSLWLHGNFCYQQKKQGTPWLSILADFRLYNGTEAWHYLPQQIISKSLVGYLSRAIQGGEIDNATLIYRGNPQHFPYFKNKDIFKIFIPLRNSTLQFQPNWPKLTNLNIDLKLVNHTLWMRAPHVKLGKIDAKDIKVMIPNYFKAPLLMIDAKIIGDSNHFYNYLKQTPMHNWIGSALNKLKLSGNVKGHLHLDIPLNSGQIKTKGVVKLYNNSPQINLLEDKLHARYHKFSFKNGNLQSNNISVQWLEQPTIIKFSTGTRKKDYIININLKTIWKFNKLPTIPQEITKNINGIISWIGNITVVLPHYGKANYDITLDADLTKVNSYLPLPLTKPAGKEFSLKLHIKGDSKQFKLISKIGKQNHFNSEWIIDKKQVTLIRAIYQNISGKILPLPVSKSLIIHLPLLDCEQWLALLAQTLKHNRNLNNISFPDTIILKTPQMLLGGQVWHQITLITKNQQNEVQVSAKGNEINGNLQILNKKPWRANINYLYYNPQFTHNINSLMTINTNSQATYLHNWPELTLHCKSCWVLGKNLGKVEANLTYKKNNLTLNYGLIDTGQDHITSSGQYNLSTQGVNSSFKGKIIGNKLDNTAAYFGITAPLHGGPYNINYDLHWYGQPWQPQINTISGTLDITIGKGKINSIGGSYIEQLLRLVSVNTLLRKLHFDFSDTIGKGFYFDSIHGLASLQNGILHTNNLLIDGLAADISIIGEIDLAHNYINMTAIVAPAISTTISVATALIVNPIVGAAIFAASQVLKPIWRKIPVIRYYISGNLQQPNIYGAFHEPKKNKSP